MNFSRTHMPEIICGRGSISFVTTLNKKRVAVLGYADSVKQLAEQLFAGTDTEVCYIGTFDREPFINDLFASVEKCVTLSLT